MLAGCTTNNAVTMSLFSCVFVLLVSFTCIQSETQSISTKISENVKNLLENKRKTLEFANNVNALYSIKDQNTQYEEICRTCVNTVNTIIQSRHYGMTSEDFKHHIYNLCLLFTDWDKSTCTGYIEVESPTVLYMIDNKKDLTGERVCSIYFQYLGCKDPNRKDWDVNIPNITEKTEEPTNTNANGNDTEIAKILHLTDFHYDPLYQPGSNAKCEFQLCCQNNSGIAKNPKDAAGYWGDYNVCDMPWHSIEDSLDHIQDEHKNISYIYFTGDIVSHRSWDTTIESNKAAIKKVFDELFNKFKDRDGLKVFPILGNHESHPTDFWIDSNNTMVSTQWLFDHVAALWSRWLQPKALQTVKKGGYYTVLIKKGFRLIALNSNVCYTANFWLFYEDKDPFGQLQWLVDTLKDAETDKESVHIISHVPPGNKMCLKNWNEVYNRIVMRFSKIIKGQFNGHTHYDQFRLHYSEDKKTVINVAYNGGSLTTFIGNNPNYRLYDVDMTTYEVVDYDQWTYNMTLANLTPKERPKWKKLYSFKQAYGVNSMRLDELGKLVERMEKNKTLLNQYYRFEVREAAGALSKGCDDNCLQGKLCSIKSTHFDDSILCSDE